MVWCSGMADWTEARNVKELEFLFNPNVSYTPPVSNSQNQRESVSGNSQQNQRMYDSNVYGRNDVRPMPKNWLVESILVTVCCCLPFGIAGIIYATKVESLYYSGDYEGAEQAAKDAKKWTVIGFFGMLVPFILYILIVFIFSFTSGFF